MSETENAGAALAKKPQILESIDAPAKPTKRVAKKPIFVYPATPALAIAVVTHKDAFDKYNNKFRKVDTHTTLNLTGVVFARFDEATQPAEVAACRARAKSSRDLLILDAEVPDDVIREFRIQIEAHKAAFQPTGYVDADAVLAAQGRLKPVYEAMIERIKQWIKEE